MSFSSVYTILINYYDQILAGVGTTLAVSLIGTIIGLIIGLLIGSARSIPRSHNKVVAVFQRIANFVMNAYVEIFRGTPMMVQAMVIYWGYAIASGGVTMNTYFAAVLIVSVNTGAYITEIVRGGINSIDKGQMEGAKAIGMGYTNTMVNVILPQTMKNILPAVSNEFVVNIKDTSVLTVLIGFVDLFAVGNIIQLATYKMFEAYLIISVVYFILTFTVTRILRLFEKMLNGKSSYEMYNTNLVSKVPEEVA